MGKGGVRVAAEMEGESCKGLAHGPLAIVDPIWDGGKKDASFSRQTKRVGAVSRAFGIKGSELYSMITSRLLD